MRDFRKSADRDRGGPLPMFGGGERNQPGNHGGGLLSGFGCNRNHLLGSTALLRVRSTARRASSEIDAKGVCNSLFSYARKSSGPPPPVFRYGKACFLHGTLVQQANGDANADCQGVAQVPARQRRTRERGPPGPVPARRPLPLARTSARIAGNAADLPCRHHPSGRGCDRYPGLPTGCGSGSMPQRPPGCPWGAWTAKLTFGTKALRQPHPGSWPRDCKCRGRPCHSHDRGQRFGDGLENRLRRGGAEDLLAQFTYVRRSVSRWVRRPAFTAPKEKADQQDDAQRTGKRERR